MKNNTATEYFDQLSRLIQSVEVTDLHGVALNLDEGATKAVQMILEIRSASKKIMLIGNGGSAAIVSHVQNDLCKAIGARALVFTEQPLLTALANDDGYGSVFEQSIKLWAEAGDLLITVSSSGESENIVRGLKAAQDKDCKIITLSGFSSGNTSRQSGDLNFYVPSDVYGLVEPAHMALCHFVTDTARATKSKFLSTGTHR